jgi:hypothetical protein
MPAAIAHAQLDHGSGRATPVAVGVFDFHWQLRKGLAELGNPHHRVKAETVAAGRFARDVANDAADRNQRLGVLRAAHRHQGADQGGAPVVDVAHLRQQCLHVVVIALLKSELGRVEGRLDTGQAAKGIDAQAGIVGQRRQAAELGSVARFGQGVFDKRAVGFRRFGDAQLALRHQFKTQGRKHGAQLGQLAQVVGCQNNFLHKIRL